MTLTTVKERPISLRDWEVRGILDGRKTQFRRPIKGLLVVGDNHFEGGSYFQMKGIKGLSAISQVRNVLPEFCPYGQPGDRLWVRETAWYDSSGSIWHYRAAAKRWPPNKDGGKTKPPIHMPRWASRILLEITNVRAERTQDITYGQANDWVWVLEVKRV